MTAKRTEMQKRIDKAVGDAFAKHGATTSVSGNTFVGVQYDAKAVDAIETIAAGLVENAKALGQLASVLKSSNVKIDCMLRT